jgi:quercetin 2,3-dioxygenase
MSHRSIQSIITPPPHHWVGDGFRVHNFIPGKVAWGQISPFVMLDYGATHYFEPSDTPGGVGSHPHRGFETVTIAYKGRVQHHDSRGNTGIIGTGEVQWMTAGSGILHKEYHEKQWAKQGGEFQMVQLWVNLPAKDKMTEPKYQAITREDIVHVDLPDSTGSVQVIAGEYEDHKGPAFTFTPINLWNIHLNQGAQTKIEIPEHHNLALLILEGSVEINGREIQENNLVLFAHDGSEISLKSAANSIVLVMSGEPINEPIASYGPFLMNTREEIIQAIDDFNAGKFGELE